MAESDSYTPDLPHLYIAEIKDTTVPSERYVYFHEFAEGSGTFPYDGLSMEYLKGYVEGATTHRESKLVVKNGLPEQHRCAFERFNLAPLSKEDLEEFLDGTSLRSRYPYLAE